MLAKLSVALLGALAIAAQAGLQHGSEKHYGHHKRHNIKLMSAYDNQTTSLPTVSSSLGNSPTQASSAPAKSYITGTLSGSSSNPVSGSSSIILSTGGSAGPSIPLTTGASSTGGNSPIQTGGDHVLMYTLGTGSSTTVVTTTIKETSTQININTVYATSGSEAGATGGSEDGSEPTTTITSISTSTEYRTVVPTSSGIGNSPVDASGSGNGPAGASGSGNCPVPVIVTVTGSPVVSSCTWLIASFCIFTDIDQQTVTVTADTGPSAPASSGSDDSPISSSAPYPVTTKKTKTKCPTASTGFITKPYPTFTSNPSASITFAHPAGTMGYM
ncbi:MAG: hypothetical protein LQ343_005552 [Gyalolechia ehrenbergii]|nr:MAG: hypothetical protein LQ343_005552 [Gyalolechia ehrenbergii]